MRTQRSVKRISRDAERGKQVYSTLLLSFLLWSKEERSRDVDRRYHDWIHGNGNVHGSLQAGSPGSVSALPLRLSLRLLELASFDLVEAAVPAGLAVVVLANIPLLVRVTSTVATQDR